MSRLCTETAPGTCAGEKNILWSCWSHQKVGQEADFCHNSCLALANIQKWQTALLAEIFQNTDYLLLLLLLERKVCLWKREEKEKQYQAELRKNLLTHQSKGWSDIISQALIFVWCVYANFRAYKKCIHTSPILPNSLPSHAELSAVSSNFSHTVSENACQDNKFIVTNCKFCRNLSWGLTF